MQFSQQKDLLTQRAMIFILLKKLLCLSLVLGLLTSTDIDFKVSKGYFGKIHTRSSLAIQFTDLYGGVIDFDYRGPVVVVFLNFSNRHFEIKKGQRLVQIIFQKIAWPVLREVLTFEGSRTVQIQGAFESSGGSTCVTKI